MEPPAPREDDRLGPVLERYLLSGDEEAMEEIVRRTRAKLLAAARRIGSPQDAEDAVQSAYFSLLRKRGARLEAPVLPWLLTAVVRIAYRQKAKQQRQHAIARRLSRPTEGASPPPDPATAEEADRVRKAISRLPAKYRDPIVLRHLNGLTTAETAELLGIREATVRTRLFRGRELVRRRFPVRLTYGILVLPWLLKDTARAACGSISAALTATAIQVPVAVGAVVVAGAIGAATGRWGLPPEVGPARPAAAEERLVELAGQAEDLEAALEAARERGEAATRRRRRSEADLAAVRVEARVLEGALVGGLVNRPPPIPDAGAPGALAGADWRTVGEVVAKIVPRVLAITRHLIRRETPDPEDRGRVQQWSGVLIREVGRLGGGVPTRLINHRFNDPDFVANALASTLEAMGRPLSESQKREIAEEARLAASEDAERLARYCEETTALTRLREECALKDRFVRAVFERLTVEQREAVSPESLRHRLALDIFSAAVLWVGKLRCMVFEREEDLGMQAVSNVAALLTLSETERELAAPVVREWVRNLPGGFLHQDVDLLTRYGHVRLPRILEMARRSDHLFETVAERLALDTGRRKKIRETELVLMPLRFGGACETEEK